MVTMGTMKRKRDICMGVQVVAKRRRSENGGSDDLPSGLKPTYSQETILSEISSVTSRTTRRRRTGKGQLQMSAYMNYGHLTVHIVAGRRMSSTWKKHPDTFVMLSLIPDEDDTTPIRCRTSVVRETSRPHYNEKFSFEVSDDDLNKRLLVTVWHRDTNSGLNEHLGCTSFGLRHLKSAVKVINGWYHLLTEDVGCSKHLQIRERHRPSPAVCDFSRVPSINQDVTGDQQRDITIHRSVNGGFGFTLVDACPVKVGRVDSSSRAEEAGLLPGDVIIRVNGQNVSRSTSVSVARCIKKSGSMVALEIHRPAVVAPMSSSDCQPTTSTTATHNTSYGASVQEFSICDDKAALLDNTISETQRQAALHRLLVLEENFVDKMNDGILTFSRPLRHRILTPTQHSALFQNIEKLMCMSRYQAHQIVDNLPSYTPSDDDTDTSFADHDNFTTAVGMIYLSKLPTLVQAYKTYTTGLTVASHVLGRLEMNEHFRNFLLNAPHQRDMSLCDFLNSPLQHLTETLGVMGVILSTLPTQTREHLTFEQIVRGLQSCVDASQDVRPVVSRLHPSCHQPAAPYGAPSSKKVPPSTMKAPSTTMKAPRTMMTAPSTIRQAPPTSQCDISQSRPSGRRVPMMGSFMLKRASSQRSSSSGFGSGSSDGQPDITPCNTDTESCLSWFEGELGRSAFF